MIQSFLIIDFRIPYKRELTAGPFSLLNRSYSSRLLSVIVCGVYRPLFGFANVGVSALIGEKSSHLTGWQDRLLLDHHSLQLSQVKTCDPNFCWCSLQSRVLFTCLSAADLNKYASFPVQRFAHVNKRGFLQKQKVFYQSTLFSMSCM